MIHSGCIQCIPINLYNYKIAQYLLVAFTSECIFALSSSPQYLENDLLTLLFFDDFARSVSLFFIDAIIWWRRPHSHSG